MAEICLVIGCSHSPFLYIDPDAWDKIRAKRPVREDTPRDPPEVNKAKFECCMKAFARLREKLEAAKPDVLLVFGDDQLEQFNFGNFPAMGVYLGSEAEAGRERASHLHRILGQQIPSGERIKVRGHPELGRELMMGLIKKGFDLAFSLELPEKGKGMGHAFVNPSYYINPSFEIPILPFFVNCYYAPQPTGKRCYELGKAVRQVVEESSLKLKVAVIGSGGLWHTPGVPSAYLDEEFDKAILKRVENGSAREMAEYFDSVPWPYPSASPEVAHELSGRTGMAAGVGSGVGETRNWLVAASVADGLKGTVVDYVPVYASPCGMGFAYWDRQ
jgi:hypothetical protein